MQGHAATRLKIFITTLVILTLAMAFNGGLSISSLEKVSLGSLISRYQVVANAFRSQVAQSIRYGKPLERFFGITRNMEEVRADLPDLSTIMVATTGGRVLYSLDEAKVGQQWPELAGAEAREIKSSGEGRRVFQAGEAYYAEFPIVVQEAPGQDAAVKGLVIFGFPAGLVQSRLTSIISQNLDILVFVTLVAAAVLGVLLTFFLPLDPGRFSKVRLYLILVLALGGAQCVYSLYNVQSFRDNFLDITRTNTEKVARLLKQDVDYLLSKGLRVDRLNQVDAYLAKTLAVTPEIQEMSILDSGGRVLYRADASGPVAVQGGAFAAGGSGEDIEVPLIKTAKDGSTSREGVLRAVLSGKVIAEKVREIILDSATVGVIAILFLLELVILFLIFLRETTMAGAAASKAEEDSNRYAIIRPVAFLFLFAMDLCISFIPLYMEDLYQPFLGLSREMVMGLPISVEMFFAGLMVLISGVWTDRRGWFEPFFAGAALACAGYVYSGLAGNALQFVLARGLVGAGYGLALMASEGFVVDNTGPRSRAQGITHLFAGVYAGSLCGGAAGAMLADRLGFKPVFLVSAGIMLCMMAAVFAVLRGSFHRPVRKPGALVETISLAKIRKFLFDRNVLGLLIMNIMPGALILVGFINFLIPVYLNRIGTTQSNIGRVLMIYGVCLIYVAPTISRFVDRSQRKRMYIFLSGIIGALGLTGYYFHGGLLTTGLAALMLGISSSLGFAAQNAFALNLKITHETGHGVAMGISNAIERVGQVLGPLTLGWIIVSFGMEKGIASAGVIYLSVSVLFLLIVREKGATVDAGDSA